MKESFRGSLLLMLTMGLAMLLIMYVSTSTAVGFMLGTRRGAAFDKFCEESRLNEMRGKGMTFLRKHEVLPIREDHVEREKLLQETRSAC